MTHAVLLLHVILGVMEHQRHGLISPSQPTCFKVYLITPSSEHVDRVMISCSSKSPVLNKGQVICFLTSRPPPAHVTFPISDYHLSRNYHDMIHASRLQRYHL
ncbi:hypothetical protein DER46DRAFT_23852 [Fusarium sp. MPI-SDFR-AT-0072]|nr:hypothetical protein DER46DRAFT_23852 [Fusarium sp. MPI-SDFR-AT-0072]